jgi:hypothetical protein
MMAKIKSAIELAMERTKNLVMNEKEKEEFARRGLEDKLKAIMRRFLEGMIGRKEFPDELGGMKAGKRERRLLLIDLILEEFDLPGDKERLFDLLELVGEEAGGGLANDARRLKDRFREELKANAAGVRAEIMTRLARMGISGTSIEPNTEEWEEWKDAAQKTGSLFKKRLHEWKDKAENAPA